MKVSAISFSEDCKPRRNLFINYANSFMSVPQTQDPIEKTQQKPTKMGIEDLEEFTIFPKSVINGKMTITA